MSCVDKINYCVPMPVKCSTYPNLHVHVYLFPVQDYFVITLNINHKGLKGGINAPP